MKKAERSDFLPWTLDVPCWILGVQKGTAHFRGAAPTLENEGNAMQMIEAGCVKVCAHVSGSELG